MEGMAQYHNISIPMKKIADISKFSKQEKGYVLMLWKNTHIFCRGTEVRDGNIALVGLFHGAFILKFNVDGGRGRSKRCVCNERSQRSGRISASTANSRVIIIVLGRK